MSSLVRLLPYLRRYRRNYATGLVAVVVTATLALLAPWVLQHAIDDLGRSITKYRLAGYGAALIALAVAGGGARFLMRRVIIGASRHIEAELRDAFFAHLMRLPLSYFRARRTGDLMSRATSDLEAVRLMIGISVIDAFNTAIVFVVAVGLMLSIDPRLTFIALAPLPFVSLSVKLFGSAIHGRFQKVQAQLSEVASLSLEGLSSVRLIRAFGQEEAHVERFANATRQYFARNRSLIRLQSAFYATMAFCLGLGSLLVLWVGSGAVIRGQMTLGQFVAFTAYQVMLGVPMVAFGSLTNTLQRGIASWNRMREVFDEREAGEGVGAGFVGGTQGAHAAPVMMPVIASARIEVRHLTFSYAPDIPPVLRDVSFTAEPGLTVAIVGGTGSGKSTLLHLLPRLFEPPRGTLFVEGADVRDIPLEALRASIGFVPQEPFLFAETLAENIAFAPPAASPSNGAAVERPGGMAREEPPPQAELLSGGFDLRGTGTHHLALPSFDAVRRAAAIARLDRDLPELPLGYETQLGERGILLSGGQRQRTALARALVMRTPILVLDDATSAVDTKTEGEILRGLRADRRQRTSVIVSNRFSSIRDSDLILVLDGGRVVERGRHDELITLGGTYATLYRKQLLQEALEVS